MDNDELDAAILSHTRIRWLKVARIACDVLDEMNLPISDNEVEIVMVRMQALVARSALLAAGDMIRPRYSEIRLPGAEDVARDERGS
ncbi:MAG: hypothetical protein E7774_01305 [Bradyrhizobium sp.]|nr:MAG: hypothetical protein E7774_01305 [Bradyrhizobium sp.]